jgi:prepilin-type N-terminal cleavage/methylation domain-containing protein
MNSNGFSLIELVVSIAIFGFLATAVFVNLRGASPSQEIQLQASNIVSALRQAEVQSKAGEPFNGQTPIGGYGLTVAECSTPPCSVDLFADLNGDWTIQTPAETVQTISLGQNVTVNSVSLAPSVDITFKPPKPFICFNADCSGVGELVITLGSIESTRTAEIRINQISGQVSY